jgi:hypothetical protein
MRISKIQIFLNVLLVSNLGFRASNLTLIVACP